MFTDRYCPECGLRLKELRAGPEHTGEVYCRNQHVWTWTIDGYYSDTAYLETLTRRISKESR